MNKKCYVFYNVFVNICLTVKKIAYKSFRLGVNFTLFSRLIGGFDEVDLFETICPS